MTDRPLAAASERLRKKPGRPRKPRPEPEGVASPAVPPARLLDLPAAARYLTLSTWTLRDLISSGTIRRVRIPLPNGGELRKVLLDREDLDALVSRWKEAAP